MKKIAILNGPNMDRLGLREPDVYGHETLADLEKLLKDEAETLGVEVEFFQSNQEGDLIDKIAALADAKSDGSARRCCRFGSADGRGAHFQRFPARRFSSPIFDRTSFSGHHIGVGI